MVAGNVSRKFRLSDDTEDVLVERCVTFFPALDELPCITRQDAHGVERGRNRRGFFLRTQDGLSQHGVEDIVSTFRQRGDAGRVLQKKRRIVTEVEPHLLTRIS